MLNLANPLPIVLEYCRPEVLALCICPYPPSNYSPVPSRRYLFAVKSLLLILACYAASVVPRDLLLLLLLHGDASRKHGTRQRAGPGGFPTTTLLRLLSTHTPTSIRRPQCARQPLHTPTAAAHLPAGTPSVAAIAACGREEALAAITAVHLEPAGNCW